MTKMYVEYKDDITFHPGYYLNSIIDDMEITQEEFAKRVGTTPKTISKIINGLASVTNKLANHFSVVTGTSIDFWENLQNQYDNALIKIEEKSKIDQECKLLDFIDYGYFVKNQNLEETRKREKKVINLRRYLKVASLSTFLEPNLLANFRMSGGNFESKNIINSNIWLQTAQNIAREIEVKPFDEKRLNQYIDEIRKMTLLNPQVFLPDLKEKFESCGLAFVLLPHLKNSGINGVTKWLSKDKVLVALNDKTYKADSFWFSLFHELKHVFQKKRKTVFVNTEKNDGIDISLETEADEYARNILIPPRDFKDFIDKGIFTKESIKHFAHEINIHPGIVVGRLQYDKHIKYSSFNDLKDRYEIAHF